MSNYITIKNLQDPNSKSLLIISPNDPLHFHLSRIKSLQKDRNELKVEPSNKVQSSPYPVHDHPIYNEEDDFVVDDDNNSNNNKTNHEDSGLYQMVGGVLVLPVNKSNNTNTNNTKSSSISKSPSQPEPQVKWKPVSLPPPSSTPKTSTQPNSKSNNGNFKNNVKKVKNNNNISNNNNELDEPQILHITKEDFVHRIKSALVSYHALILPTGEMTIATGSAPMITIEAEMRSGNKVVTKMTGLEVYI